MAFSQLLRTTAAAMAQIFLLGWVGYMLVKRNRMSDESLRFLSGLLIKVLMPCFMFAKIIGNFTFGKYPHWWLFPILSVVITIVGFIVGKLFVRADKRLRSMQEEFVMLVTFQNSGYLPLILIALLMPPAAQEQLYIYLFLFLLGFNALVWSVGVAYLVKDQQNKLALKEMLSPPVIAMIVSLLLVAVRVHFLIPAFVVNAADMLGQCVLPLALIVVGGNLARVEIKTKQYAHALVDLVLAKLFVLPLVCLGVLMIIRPPHAIAFLLLLECAVPSATSLSVIVRHHQKEDVIVSAGIFWTHLVSLITISLFIILFRLAWACTFL